MAIERCFITDDEVHKVHGYRFTTSNARFELPATSQVVLSSPAVGYFETAVTALSEFDDKRIAVMSDRLLSDAGKRAKLDPLRAETAGHIARSWAAIDKYSADINAQENALVRVPEIDRGHNVMAIEDREIRDWWRSQPAADRARMLNRLQIEPGHERLMLALLRSPIPQLAHEISVARDVWQRTCRLDHPDRAEAIAQGRAAVEWSRRGLATIAGLAIPLIGWDRLQLLKALLNTNNEYQQKGVGAFGFDAFQAAQARLEMQAEAQMKRAA